MEKRIISALVVNKSNVLSKVVRLFSARNFNIHSLAVGPTEDDRISRMTIVVRGDDRVLDQVMKQLDSLIDVIKVVDLGKEEIVAKEFMIVKIEPCSTEERILALLMIDTIKESRVIYNGEVITVEMTAREDKIRKFLESMERFTIREVVRSGTIAVSREMIVSNIA